MKTAKCIILILTILILCPLHVFCLEKLSSGAMKKATAQAGVSIAVSDVAVEHYESSSKYEHPDDSSQYFEFNNLHAMSNISTFGVTDTNGTITYRYNPLTIDVGSYGDVVALQIKSNDLQVWSDYTYSNMNFSGFSLDGSGLPNGYTMKDLGSLSVTKMMFSSLDLIMTPHMSGNMGVDLSFSTCFSIDKLTYTYNSAITDGNLTLTGLKLAGSYTSNANDDITDPTKWISSGTFQIGYIDKTSSSNSTPASLDVGTNTSSGASCIVANLPMTGSMRIANLKFGGADFGPVIMDGIKVNSLLIEIPGRGLGKP